MIASTATVSLSELASAATTGPPLLPLLLWKTPPGLEIILRQEGIPFETIHEPHPIVLHRGRFVLFDSQSEESARGIPVGVDQVAIDINTLRNGWAYDPFTALIDTQAGLCSWTVAGVSLTERVAAFDKGSIRRALLSRLREEVTRLGGLWIRLAVFPYPYRGAFNLRLDLDEPIPTDYHRFADARRPLDDCTTHFVSTAAYGLDESVLTDLKHVDTQSHGHFHVVYRDPASNRRNLERAHDCLIAAGFDPIGFAAPEGRWNPGLDAAIERLGYRYSSDFSVGYDDLPFFPWRGDRFSKVLQVPIHPICEGLFLNAGRDDAASIATHLVQVVRARIDQGEPAFVYGHPERRLARFPEVLAALAREIERYDLLWRSTLTEFAHWWAWRGQRRWSVTARGSGRVEVAFEDWSDSYPLTLEIVRGSHVASLPMIRPRGTLQFDGLSFERSTARADLPTPSLVRRPFSLKAAVRSAIDWETITPVEELDDSSPSLLLKKTLRRLRDRWRSPGSPGVDLRFGSRHR